MVQLSAEKGRFKIYKRCTLEMGNTEIQREHFQRRIRVDYIRCDVICISKGEEVVVFI